MLLIYTLFRVRVPCPCPVLVPMLCVGKYTDGRSAPLKYLRVLEAHGDAERPPDRPALVQGT